MGARTAEQIIDNALLSAGDDSIGDLALDWLNDWLRSIYAGWAWPNLRRRASAISLAASSSSILLGVGEGGITEGIHRIFPPVSVYTTDRTILSKVGIAQSHGTVQSFLDQNFPSTPGYIRSFKYFRQPTPDGQIALVPLASPISGVLVAFDYQERPLNLATAGNTPLYENDRTMEQAVIQKALGHMYGPSSQEAMTALEVLRAMVAEDRLKYGSVAGDGDFIALDSSVFR